jgi:hypothetical protein
MEEHRQRQAEAVAAEAEAQRALMAGDDARAGFARAAELYRESWALAPPGAYGRLVGALKAAVLAGDAAATARYVREQIADPGESATAWYAVGLAALVTGDDAGATTAAAAMGAAAPRAPAGGADAFERAARAIAALAAADRAGYAEAVTAIVRDFEARTDHLTGVAIADTALVLERLAAPRGLAAGVESVVLPR